MIKELIKRTIIKLLFLTTLLTYLMGCSNDEGGNNRNTSKYSLLNYHEINRLNNFQKLWYLEGINDVADYQLFQSEKDTSIYISVKITDIKKYENIYMDNYKINKINEYLCDSYPNIHLLQLDFLVKKNDTILATEYHYTNTYIKKNGYHLGRGTIIDNKLLLSYSFKKYKDTISNVKNLHKEAVFNWNDIFSYIKKNKTLK